MRKRFTEADLKKKGLKILAPSGKSRLDIYAESKITYESNGKPSRDLAPGFYLFDTEPTSKPRMIKGDKWLFRYPDYKLSPSQLKRKIALRKYWSFKTRIQQQASKMGFIFPESGAFIKFNIPMPASWSKKKRSFMNHRPHQQTPDLDNLIKALKDCLCPAGDSYIHHYIPTKHWSEKGSIEISLL